MVKYSKIKLKKNLQNRPCLVVVLVESDQMGKAMARGMVLYLGKEVSGRLPIDDEVPHPRRVDAVNRVVGNHSVSGQLFVHLL